MVNMMGDTLLDNMRAIKRHADMCITDINEQIRELMLERERYAETSARAERMIDEHMEAKRSGRLVQ